MSLYETFYSHAVVMNKTKVPDGVGGFVNGWTEGAEISGADTPETADFQEEE